MKTAHCVKCDCTVNVYNNYRINLTNAINIIKLNYKLKKHKTITSSMGLCTSAPAKPK